MARFLFSIAVCVFLEESYGREVAGLRGMQEYVTRDADLSSLWKGHHKRRAHTSHHHHSAHHHGHRHNVAFSRREPPVDAPTVIHVKRRGGGYRNESGPSLVPPVESRMSRSEGREAEQGEKARRDISIDAAKHQAHHIATKVREAPRNIPREMENDRALVHSYFMPGWHVDVEILQTTLAILLISLVWFAIWSGCLYKFDRVPIHVTREKMEAWKKNTGADWERKLLFGLLHHDRFAKLPAKFKPPDVVIVFPNPAFEGNRDAEKQVPAPIVEQMLPLQTSRSDNHFGRMERLLEPFGREQFREQIADEGFVKNTVSEIFDIFKRATAGLEDGPKRDKLRIALLQDLYEMLPAMGFHVSLFSSIDDDELYLGISISNQRRAHFYLHTQHRELQMTREVVEKLGVGESSSSHAMSPPFLRFDPWMVSRLYDRGIIERDDPSALFMTDKHGGGSIVENLERVRLINQCLTKVIDLDQAVSNGLIVDWYPAQSLPSLHRLGGVWAGFSNWFDLSFVQPIPLLNQYFGPQVAFSFGWNGLYCKALLALLPIAMLSEFANSFLGMRQVTSLSIVIITWSKMASNLWDREETYFRKLWNLAAAVDARIPRPQFYGKLKKCEVDSNRLDIAYAAWKYRVRQFVSGLTASILCCFVAASILTWVTIFEGQMDIYASVCLAIQVKIFELFFNRIAWSLTVFENHKFQVHFYNSLLWKLFALQTVNSYSAFLFLAIKQRHTEHGCPEEGCFTVLRQQLAVTLMILVLARVCEVIGQSLIVRFKLWQEDKALRKACPGEEPPKRSFTEEQAKYTKFGIYEQIQVMSQLMLALGYIILFGGIAPVIIPFCLLEFAVQMRASAFILVTGTQRPFPREVVGMGAWMEVQKLLMQLGVLFAGFLIVEYGDMFRGEALITRLVAVLAFAVIVNCVWRMVDMAWPPACVEADLLEARRARVKHAVMEETAQAAADMERRTGTNSFDVMFSADAPALNASHGQEHSHVMGGRWEEIPRYHSWVDHSSPSRGPSASNEA